MPTILSPANNNVTQYIISYNLSFWHHTTSRQAVTPVYLPMIHIFRESILAWTINSFFYDKCRNLLFYEYTIGKITYYCITLNKPPGHIHWDILRIDITLNMDRKSEHFKWTFWAQRCCYTLNKIRHFVICSHLYYSTVKYQTLLTYTRRNVPDTMHI